MTPSHARTILDLIHARCKCGRAATKGLVNGAGRDLFVRACDAHAGLLPVTQSHAVSVLGVPSNPTLPDGPPTSSGGPAWRDLPQAEAIRALEAEAGTR